MELLSALFGEAWDHRRRRHRLIGASLILAAAAIAAGLLIGTAGRAPAGTPAARAYRLEPASNVLAFHMVSTARTSLERGVRTGIVIGLKRPAYSVVAMVQGQSAQLRSLSSRNGVLTDIAFAGSFWPASLRAVTQVGQHSAHVATVNLLIRLRITYRDGDQVATSYRQSIDGRSL